MHACLAVPGRDLPGPPFLFLCRALLSCAELSCAGMGLAIWARLQLCVARTRARWSARVVTTRAQGGLQLVRAADVRASTVVNAEAAAAPRGGAPLAGAPGARGAPGRVASASARAMLPQLNH